MSKYKVLNKDQIESLRKKILQKIAGVEEDMVDLKELTKPISPENAIGRISRMDAINNKSINDAALHNAKNKLVRLKRCLQELDAESYGLCRQCGEEIEFEKLLVMPESVRCVTCIKSQR